MSLNRSTMAVMGLALSTMLISMNAQAQESGKGDGGSETDVQTEGAPPKALECQKLAVENSDGEDLEGYDIYETNAKDYDASALEDDDTFELKVDLLAGGNAMYNLTCQVDAEGKVTYDGVEKTSTVKANPGGA